MSFLKKKIIKTILAGLAAILVLAGVSRLGSNPVSYALNTVFTPVYDAAYSVVAPVRRFCSYVSKAKYYEAEIKDLKRQINTLKIENKSRTDYIKENKRLKELLDLRDSADDYDTVTARVVSYEPNSWYDTIMISKGSSDGIKKDDIVITSLGVVGRVISVGKNWAKVSTVLNINNSVGVKLARTGDVGVVSGDAGLAENKSCKLEYLSDDKALIKGDVLVTSGLGGIYPPGFVVGKVTEIMSDSAGNLEYGVVEPSVDFSSLYEVLVITYDGRDFFDEGEAYGGQGAEE